MEWFLRKKIPLTFMPSRDYMKFVSLLWIQYPDASLIHVRILRSAKRRWIEVVTTPIGLLEKTGRFRVHLYSNQPAELGRQLGFEPVENPEAVLDRWRRDHPRASVGVMAASAVYPRTQA